MVYDSEPRAKNDAGKYMHAKCAEEHARGEAEEMQRLEEQFFVKICAREQAWTPRSQATVRRQAVRTARMYWQQKNGRPAPGAWGKTLDEALPAPSPFDYVEAPRPLPNVNEHEQRFAEFEQKAKAKQAIKFSDIPWPDAEMFAACLMQAPDEEQMKKISKDWSRRWHPDSWSRYRLEPEDHERIQEAVLRVSMMVNAERAKVV